MSEDSEEIKTRERRITHLEEQHRKEMEDLNQRLQASDKQASQNARLLVVKETELAKQVGT